MNYTGKLYGKGPGRTYIPLVLTAEDVDRMQAELERWRALPSKVEALIPQTNIPLSAAAVRMEAINQVLDLIAEAGFATSNCGLCADLNKSPGIAPGA